MYDSSSNGSHKQLVDNLWQSRCFQLVMRGQHPCVDDIKSTISNGTARMLFSQYDTAAGLHLAATAAAVRGGGGVVAAAAAAAMGMGAAGRCAVQ